TDLMPNQSHTVSFSVNVTSLPISGKLENKADLTFTYKLTPTDTPVTITKESNVVIVDVKLGNLIATKVVNKLYATIGNVVNYTINIENTGNSSCVNVLFQDIIQSDGKLVSGSVKVNGVSHSDYNPNIGFNLDDIVGYGSAVVSFDVTVEKLPANYNLNNNSTVNYKYYVDPNKPAISKQYTSNTVTTVINVGSLTATKAVTKAYATINDVLTYTVTVVNSGNTIAKNINFRDVVPTGVTFVNGSVTIDGTAYESYNPYGSFTLGNMNPGATVVVKFDVKVTSLPSPSLITNIANLTFSYKVDPSGADIAVQVNTNPATTQINLGSLALTKSADKMYATMGDVLTYTVVVNNNGNVRADNIIFTDALQADIAFNAGSVIVNGKSEPDFNPSLGFSLGNIEVLSQTTVIFTVTVKQNTTADSVLNNASTAFSYKIDPNGQYYSKSVQSNTVSTIIVRPGLTATKVVNKAYATLQDVLNYSIQVKNSGNRKISKLSFKDFLSNGATFLSGSLKIDGVEYSSFDPIAGFNLPNDLIPGQDVMVEFQATVTSVPTPPQVTNYAAVNGEYYINPQGQPYPITAESNTVTTNINVGSLSNNKAVDKMFAKVNDTVNYTSTITNTGNVNATNLSFTDAMQAELSFVSGTVSINGVLYPSLNPTNGFALSNLAPNQSVTVAFTAKINALPSNAYVSNTSNINFSYLINPSGSVITKDQISNTVTTNVVLGKLNVVKVVDKSLATIDDVLTYTITLTNMGNVVCNEVLFQDTPSQGVKFKSGSVKVNGKSEASFDPTLGFSLGDVGIGNVVNVEFKVDVISVPPTNKVTNQAVIPFKYVVDPKQQPFSDTAYSNTVTTNIALGNLTVNKVVNKKYATIGEEITYTVTITNAGNINATNVVFLDPTPNNSTFVIGSVTINGVAYTDYNPSAGFNLNTMTPGQIITVVYKVKVVNKC
ncbi:MAG: DUF7507 domain-containing protein, partial [Clostridium sp.]